MRRIVLINPDCANKAVSVQLREAGLPVADSNYRTAKQSIFVEFRRMASDYYSVVAQGDYGGDAKWCGLCGHEIHEYYTIMNTKAPLVTSHPELDVEIEWPSEMRLGSSCVRALYIDTYATNMYNSMFFLRHSYRVTDHGLIRFGHIVRHYDDWAYGLLLVPHSLFTTLPADVMREAHVDVFLLNNPVSLQCCTQRTLQRSLNAKSLGAKYKPYMRMTDVLVQGDKCGADTAFAKLATIISREQAKKVCEIGYKMKESRR